jgi:hypothetical protein
MGQETRVNGIFILNYLNKNRGGLGFFFLQKPSLSCFLLKKIGAKGTESKSSIKEADTSKLNQSELPALSTNRSEKSSRSSSSLSSSLSSRSVKSTKSESKSDRSEKKAAAVASPTESKTPEPVESDANLEKYEVIVKTADEENAETDASVLIGLYGEKSDALYVPLMQKSANGLFNRNSIERFELKLKDTGKIKKIVLRHNGTGRGAAWKVEYVKIIHREEVYL